MKRISFAAVLAAVLCMALCACAPRHAAQPIEEDISVGIAPFTQPMSTADMLLGQLPEKAGKMPADMALQLDRDFSMALRKNTKRRTVALPHRNVPAGNAMHNAVSAAALPKWVAYGKQNKVRLLVVPQVLNWEERRGSAAGVTEAAAVCIVFYMVDVERGEIVTRSVTEEKQVGLLDDLSRVGSFFKRHGAWITAEEMAQEAMVKAIKELGL